MILKPRKINDCNERMLHYAREWMAHCDDEHLAGALNEKCNVWRDALKAEENAWKERGYRVMYCADDTTYYVTNSSQIISVE